MKMISFLWNQSNKIIFCIVAILTASSIAFAQNETPLFKDLLFNKHKSVLEQDKTFEDCSREIGSAALCKENVKFLEHEFIQVLIFIDERLRLVQLVTEFDLSLHQKIFKVLANQFSLVAMQSGDKRLDILNVVSTEKRDVGVSKIGAFEQGGLETGKLSYIFSELPRKDAKKYKNYGEYVRSIPENTREITLEIEQEGKESAYLRVYFALPKRALGEMRKSSPKVEKF